MMDKYLTIDSTQKSYFAELLQSDGRNDSFCKTASVIPDILKQAIEEIKPSKNKIYLIIAPLGMGEYWGPNVNGDFFPEKALRNDTKDFGYKTFLSANLFRHHINKDPHAGFGRPIVSLIDEPQKRVVTITEVDINKAKKFGAMEFLEMLSNGQLPEVSMGCRVPYDTCSICGKRSKSPKDYCTHLQRGNMLTYDKRSGKIAYAINDLPRFFDLSFVHKGADRSSGTLYKIGGDLDLFSSKEEFDISSLKKVASSNVANEIVDAVECLPEVEKSFLKEHDLWKQPRIERYVLDKFAYDKPEEILGTFFAAGIPLRADELQYISLKRNGMGKLAADLYDAGEFIDPMELQKVVSLKSESQLKFSKYSYEVATSLINKRNIFQNPISDLAPKDFCKKASFMKNSDLKEAGVFLTLMAGLSVLMKKKTLTKSIEKDPEYWLQFAPSLQKERSKQEEYFENSINPQTGESLPGGKVRTTKDNQPYEMPEWSGVSSVPPRFGYPYNLVDGIMPKMYQTNKVSADFEGSADCIRKSFLLTLHSFFNAP